jgi:hypothetical protein
LTSSGKDLKRQQMVFCVATAWGIYLDPYPDSICVFRVLQTQIANTNSQTQYLRNYQFLLRRLYPLNSMLNGARQATMGDYNQSTINIGKYYTRSTYQYA